MSLNKICGTWSLVNFEIHDPQGAATPWGKKVRGILIYSENGSMSVGINKAIESENEEDPQSILDSVLFYAGNFEVEGNTIRHHVQVASDPNRVGKTITRYADFTGDRLILRSPNESFGTAVLTWDRSK